MGIWNKEINVSDFVSKNIAPYTGDASFLQGPTELTKRIWEHLLKASRRRKEQQWRPFTGQYHRIYHHFS